MCTFPAHLFIGPRLFADAVRVLFKYSKFAQLLGSFGQWNGLDILNGAGSSGATRLASVGDASSRICTRKLGCAIDRRKTRHRRAPISILSLQSTEPPPRSGAFVCCGVRNYCQWNAIRKQCAAHYVNPLQHTCCGHQAADFVQLLYTK